MIKLSTGNPLAGSSSSSSTAAGGSGGGGGSSSGDAPAAASVSRLVRYQSYRTRTETDLECHKLMRMLVAAYYSSKHHRELEIVVDALLTCDVHADHQIAEEKIADAVRLPLKRVGGLLAILSRDHLIQSQQTHEVLSEEEALKRKRSKFKRGTEKRSWYVDYDLLLKVLKYRHEMIFAALSKTIDKADMYFVCPNPRCENRRPNTREGKKWSLVDLLSERLYLGKAPPAAPLSETSGFLEPTPVAMDEQNDFLCPAPYCQTKLIVSEDSLKALGPELEQQKARFNRQIAPLLAQMAIVERRLNDDREYFLAHRAEEAELALANKLMAGNGGSVHLKDEKRGGPAPAAAAAASTAVKPEPGATASVGPFTVKIAHSGVGAVAQAVLAAATPAAAVKPEGGGGADAPGFVPAHKLPSEIEAEAKAAKKRKSAKPAKPESEDRKAKRSKKEELKLAKEEERRLDEQRAIDATLLPWMKKDEGEAELRKREAERAQLRAQEARDAEAAKQQQFADAYQAEIRRMAAAAAAGGAAAAVTGTGGVAKVEPATARAAAVHAPAPIAAAAAAAAVSAAALPPEPTAAAMDDAFGLGGDAAAAAPAVAEVMVTVAGQPMAISAITQTELDLMTDDELAAYDALVTHE